MKKAIEIDVEFSVEELCSELARAIEKEGPLAGYEAFKAVTEAMTVKALGELWDFFGDDAYQQIVTTARDFADRAYKVAQLRKGILEELCDLCERELVDFVHDCPESENHSKIRGCPDCDDCCPLCC